MANLERQIDVTEDSKTDTEFNPWLEDSDTVRVCKATGLPLEVVARAVATHTYLLAAFGLVKDEDGVPCYQEEAAVLVRRYPDLLPSWVVDQRRSGYPIIPGGLEEEIVQRETELPPAMVKNILAALVAPYVVPAGPRGVVS